MKSVEVVASHMPPIVQGLDELEFGREGSFSQMNPKYVEMNAVGNSKVGKIFSADRNSFPILPTATLAIQADHHIKASNGPAQSVSPVLLCLEVPSLTVAWLGLGTGRKPPPRIGEARKWGGICAPGE